MHVWKISKFKAEEIINNTVWFGVVTGILTIIDPYKFSMITDNVSPLGFILAGLILSLTVGIYFKNKLPAVLLVIFLIAEGFYFAVTSIEPTIMFAAVIILRLVLLYVFARGAKAMFVYHEHVAQK